MRDARSSDKTWTWAGSNAGWSEWKRPGVVLKQTLARRINRQGDLRHVGTCRAALRREGERERAQDGGQTEWCDQATYGWPMVGASVRRCARGRGRHILGGSSARVARLWGNTREELEIDSLTEVVSRMSGRCFGSQRHTTSSRLRGRTMSRLLEAALTSSDQPWRWGRRRTGRGAARAAQRVQRAARANRGVSGRWLLPSLHGPSSCARTEQSCCYLPDRARLSIGLGRQKLSNGGWGAFHERRMYITDAPALPLYAPPCICGVGRRAITHPCCRQLLQRPIQFDDNSYLLRLMRFLTPPLCVTTY